MCAPQKIFEIFARKWRILVAFFAIHEIFSQLKGGGMAQVAQW